MQRLVGAVEGTCVLLLWQLTVLIDQCHILVLVTVILQGDTKTLGHWVKMVPPYSCP